MRRHFQDDCVVLAERPAVSKAGVAIVDPYLPCYLARDWRSEHACGTKRSLPIERETSLCAEKLGTRQLRRLSVRQAALPPGRAACSLQYARGWEAFWLDVGTISLSLGPSPRSAFLVGFVVTLSLYCSQLNLKVRKLVMLAIEIAQSWAIRGLRSGGEGVLRGRRQLNSTDTPGLAVHISPSQIRSDAHFIAKVALAGMHLGMLPIQPLPLLHHTLWRPRRSAKTSSSPPSSTKHQLHTMPPWVRAPDEADPPPLRDYVAANWAQGCA